MLRACGRVPGRRVSGAGAERGRRLPAELVTARGLRRRRLDLVQPDSAILCAIPGDPIGLHMRNKGSAAADLILFKFAKSDGTIRTRGQRP
ncbi:hypothetical protein GCM10007977_010660 [Dactylosporangium sucinum]|uniref:Uncharacterized protein n=1 Tax=Dactylosporangium sucinum TaxID=1424081 RepID=A0A917T5M5_9ACTN|nr:hypothetical protein GCM10007977_010660 [Dactylosporangium sucinum]